MITLWIAGVFAFIVAFFKKSLGSFLLGLTLIVCSIVSFMVSDIRGTDRYTMVKPIANYSNTTNDNITLVTTTGETLYMKDGKYYKTAILGRHCWIPFSPAEMVEVDFLESATNASSREAET